jgi:hypothetical protein
MVREGERLVLFNASGPIYQCKEGDGVAVRLGAVLAIDLGLAGATVLADALKLSRSTLHRVRTTYAAGGVEALREKKRGPKGPHKLTPAALGRAQRVLDSGRSRRAAAERVGVSEFAIRHAIKRGLLTPGKSKRAEKAAADSAAVLTGPRDRASVDQACAVGVATKRELDRTLACTGKLVEAEPEFEAVEGVAGAGVLLALPALLHEGLCEVGGEVYGKLRNGFFGLRSVLLTLAFMALLRIKTAEQLTEHAPGELGILLGLDRAPEVKTLRRKLRELGQRQLADTFRRRLTERWAKAAPRELALLYVDGHVHPYHGRKHVLPKHHVQQRGRPMPGTKDFHVNDRRVDPLFFVTAEATESLLATLDTSLLPEVRRLVGSRRRVTIAFDREGWSPELFAKWKKQSFDVLTYRKGEQSRWQKRFFTTVKGEVGGETVEYCLAEREVKLTNGLKVREIRRLTDDGHQTAVITTNEKLPLLAVAQRMFSRWRQENFFRYMRHEFALDHLCTHKVEPADPKRLVPHPERTNRSGHQDEAPRTRLRTRPRQDDPSRQAPGRRGRTRSDHPTARGRDSQTLSGHRQAAQARAHRRDPGTRADRKARTRTQGTRGCHQAHRLPRRKRARSTRRTTLQEASRRGAQAPQVDLHGNRRHHPGSPQTAPYCSLPRPGQSQGDPRSR